MIEIVFVYDKKISKKLQKEVARNTKLEMKANSEILFNEKTRKEDQLNLIEYLLIRFIYWFSFLFYYTKMEERNGAYYFSVNFITFLKIKDERNRRK